MKYSVFKGLRSFDPIPFKGLADPIFLRVRLAMTGSGRQKVLEEVPDQHDKNQYLRLNWEGYHLLEFANTVRPPKDDEDGTIRLDGFLESNGIGGFKELQTLPSSKKTAFTKAKSKRVFESLAAFQEIPTIVCFLNFLEFCRDSNPSRPLKVFDGDDPLPPVIIDGEEIPITLDFAIEDIKKHIKFEEESFKKEKLENESSLNAIEQQKTIQPVLTIPQAKENNTNYYANAVLQVIGREEEKARLGAFLDCDLDVAWFQLAGVAGQGKSRLAFDLIQDIKKKLNWRAGFLTEYGIESFKHDWKEWQPDAHYLLVFDYVIGREQAIKPILQTLIYNRGKFKDKKIRILLIERQRWDQGSVIKANDQRAQDETGLSVHIGDKAQWFLNLCEKKDFEGEFFKPCRFGDGVEELNELDQDDLVTIIKQLTMELVGKMRTFSDEMLKKILARIDDSGRPLYAYLLAQQLRESEEGYESWTKIDLLNYQLIRDKRRWEHAFKDKAPTWGDAHPAMELAVLATIVGEVKFQDAPIERYFDNIDSSLRKEAIAITSGWLINDDTRPQKIHALEPDLLGEWFVLYCFHQGLKFEELLDLAWDYSPDKTANFLQRITQDFIDSSKEASKWTVIEKLLAHKLRHENHYKALANVAVFIGVNLENRNLSISPNIIAALELAANSNNSDAMTYLGLLYLKGTNISRNPEKAVKWLQQASNDGRDSATYALAECYSRGEGVEQNWDKSMALFNLAHYQGSTLIAELYHQKSEQGDSAARVQLGDLYQEGDGVIQDWNKAISLYQDAIKVGEKSANDKLQRILLLQNFFDKDNFKNQKSNRLFQNITTHLAPIPFLDPPIMAASWKQLNSEEIALSLEKLAASFQILAVIKNLENYSPQCARVLPLNFYPNCSLVDIQFYNEITKNRLIISAVFNASNAILLNGNLHIIYDLNRSLLRVDSEQVAINYLQFLCSHVYDDYGPYQIITNLNEIPFVNDASISIIDKFKTSFFRPKWEKDPFHEWKEIESSHIYKACVLYGDALYATTFQMYLNATINVKEMNCIIEKLPILCRQYDGVFRSPLRPLNH